MSNRRPVLFGRSLSAALVIAAVACGGDLVLPGGPAESLALSIIMGNDQTGAVGERLPEPLIVRLETDAGLPVAGRAVAFVPAVGDVETQLEPDTAVTNSRGEALARWTLGTQPGEYAVEARVITAEGGAPVATFAASAVPGEPDTLRAVSPLSQPGRREETLPDPLVVIVVDRFGNPVSGVEVRWEVESGRGEVSEDESLTGPGGTTAVFWTLGDKPGVQQVAAKVSGLIGSPVIFTAVVLF